MSDDFFVPNLDALPSPHTRKMIEYICKSRSLDYYTVTVRPGSEKGENFFGEIYKVQVEDEDVKIDLILKTALDSPVFRENLPLRQYYCREIDAYTVVFPELKKLQAKYKLKMEDRFSFVNYYATNSEEFKEAIIVEDLTTRGFKMYDRLVSLNLEHAELAIESLAKFHAISFSMKKDDPKTFDRISKFALNKADYGKHFNKFLEQNIKQVLNVIEEKDVHQQLSNYLTNAYQKLETFLDSKLTEPYNVLCHGDCWTSNTLFKYQDDKPTEIRLIDWQLLRLASPITDITYLIFTSTDEEFRSKHLHHLLTSYYRTLSSNVEKMGGDISECYPKKIYEEQITKIFPFGLIISIALCPVLLSDKDEIPDLADATENYKNEKDSDIKLTKTPISRLRGVARDCVKYNII